MPAETATSDSAAGTAGGDESNSNQSQSQDDESTGTDDWKARAREWEKRAKANAEAAKKLAEIEEKNKTDQQKAAEKLAAAEAREAEANRILLRAQVATAKGLSPTLAERLQGNTKKEMEADADSLLAELQAGRPKPDLKQGDRGTTASGTDIDAWIRKQAGRQ